MVAPGAAAGAALVVVPVAMVAVAMVVEAVAVGWEAGVGEAGRVGACNRSINIVSAKHLLWTTATETHPSLIAPPLQ